eukprot:TRINITY_DN7659_c0_g1_i1.p3 TRINITY_DN7659_c0_g1~~TRINITY_DN7659_c0_g1_i1.p3  ORF type:complete len:51 (+),score=9.04 TRINITY_DN7659_c0_g1_i1:243-395(+)
MSPHNGGSISCKNGILASDFSHLKKKVFARWWWHKQHTSVNTLDKKENPL